MKDKYPNAEMLPKGRSITEERIAEALQAERERILRVLYISPENFASRERDYEIFHQEK